MSDYKKVKNLLEELGVAHKERPFGYNFVASDAKNIISIENGSKVKAINNECAEFRFTDEGNFIELVFYEKIRNTL